MVTGELLIPWTTFSSQTIAARTFTSQGLNPSAISQLARGIKPQHNGFEARLCGDRDGPRAEAGEGALRPRRCDHGGAASITVEVPREAYYSRVGILQIR